MSSTTVPPQANLSSTAGRPLPSAEAAARGRGLPQRLPLLANALKCAPFVLLHLVPLAAFWTGFDLTSLLLCLACYLLNMVGVTVGYHRYFAHRSYKTSRAFQFVLACLGCTALQKGPLWWASQHRHHHRHSDGPDDVHSPVSGGVFWSHLGWVFSPDSDRARGGVADLSRYPELRWLERFHWVPAILLAALCYLIGGWAGLVVGFFLSNVLSHHAVFLVNSACHLWGGRRYRTKDASRNNAVVAVLTLGEGWHNNHHHYQGSARQGFRWWEVDLGYYLIRALSAAGLVWGVRAVPAAKRAATNAEAPSPGESPAPVSLAARLATLSPATVSAVGVPLLGLAAAAVFLWR